LIDLNDAVPTLTVYDSFSAVKDGEPYNDLPGFPKDTDPPNGHYDGPGVSKSKPAGEPYSDMNCNGKRDDAGSTSDGAGARGAIVVYTVTYNGRILTPIIGRWLGKPDPKRPGHYQIPMSASVVVKNEPQVSGSSFCGKAS